LFFSGPIVDLVIDINTDSSLPVSVTGYLTSHFLASPEEGSLHFAFALCCLILDLKCSFNNSLAGCVFSNLVDYADDAALGGHSLTSLSSSLHVAGIADRQTPSILTSELKQRFKTLSMVFGW